MYRLAGTPRSLEQRSVELCLAHPRGFVTRPTAGMLRGLREQLIARHRLAPADFRRIGGELVHPARRGSAQFVAMIEARLGGGAAESHGEVVIGRGLVARGVPVVAQYHLVLPGGGLVRFDLAVPKARWAVEIDGFPRHFQLDGATSDRRRDRRSHDVGWQVDRVTTLDFADVDGCATSWPGCSGRDAHSSGSCRTPSDRLVGIDALHPSASGAHGGTQNPRVGG